MSIIIDASVTLAWAFEDERTPEVLSTLAYVSNNSAWVPAHWRLEVANSLRSAIRRGRSTITFRDETLVDLGQLPIETDIETNLHAWDATLRLSDRYGLTPYDAAYLELAQRRRLPLATLDGRLAEAAAAADVEVWPIG